MQQKLTDLNSEFKKLKIDKKETHIVYSDNTEEDDVYYLISGLEGNPELQLIVREEEELDQLAELLRKNLFVFTDFLAIKYDSTIEVILTPISIRPPFRNIDREDDDNFRILEIGVNYFKNELNVLLEVGEEGKLIGKFSYFVRGARRYSRRRPIILKIENYIKPTSEGILNDTRNIINSVLFDIEFTYDLAFETVNIENLLRRFTKRRRVVNAVPKERINLVYKKYIPELIQYFHLAEKVDFIPFKFICYYHIIEYFSDKSAYHLVSNEIKRLLLKPDFHIKTDTYVTQAINLFKKENDKYIGDKIKIERVFRQYVTRDELKDTLSELELLDYFSKENTLDCVKPLKLPAINFEQDGNFFSELTKRIYSLRCSIVHSNPDFDESKAVPFNPTPSNVEKLRIEIELIKEIARKIIIDTKE